MFKYILTAIVCLSLNVSAQQKITKQDLEDFKNRLTGTFDNNEQAAQDNSYKNVSLHIQAFELKGKHPDGDYIYVEQAMMNTQYKPERQMIYRIYREKDTIVSEAFDLLTPDRLIGAWNNTELFKKLTKDSLIKKEGCTIYFMKDDRGDFYGSTRGNGCNGSLNGASYTTTELVVYPTMLIIWERGWDNNNQQVWGPEKGGYKFRKFTNPHESND